MFYENELRFLRDIFKKLHIRTTFSSPSSQVTEIIPECFQILGNRSLSEVTVRDFFGTPENNIIYKYTHAHRLSFIFFLLPQCQTQPIFAIGPFLCEPISQAQITELAESSGVPPKDIKLLESIMSNIPVLPESSHVYAMLESFGERIWGSSTDFKVIDINLEMTSPDFKVDLRGSLDDPETVLLNMKLMEQRYNYENELMDAVTHGQSRKLTALLTPADNNYFEKRVADPLRNAKNYTIIMNTLLRKAAERGGVHPIHLDSLSSSYALKIEQLQSVKNTRELMLEMFSSYCRLVRKHSMKSYSPIVQKVILLIDSDLSASLSLSSLAATQNVSPGYLSTIFKKETGKTITEYICDERIKLASRLLTTTHLQIQTIALHCGIIDVQYFSKMFKKKTGKTPKEYREYAK
jgi:AraC-like DNA-binding protein